MSVDGPLMIRTNLLTFSLALEKEDSEKFEDLLQSKMFCTVLMLLSLGLDDPSLSLAFGNLPQLNSIRFPMARILFQ